MCAPYTCLPSSADVRHFYIQRFISHMFICLKYPALLETDKATPRNFPRETFKRRGQVLRFLRQRSPSVGDASAARSSSAGLVSMEIHCLGLNEETTILLGERAGICSYSPPCEILILPGSALWLHSSGPARTRRTKRV